MQMNEKCLLCSKVLSDHQNLLQYVLSDVLCISCRRSLKMKKRTVKIKKLKVTSFALYDDVSNALIQFKECYDEALKDMFLSEFKTWIRLHYHHCIFLCAPSSHNALKRRGFHHVKAMFEQCGIPIVDCFEKVQDISQKNTGLMQRAQIEKNIILKHKPISNKRLVLIDDTVTTGSTLLSMQKLIGEDLCTEALCMSIHPKLLTEFDRKCR